MLSLGQAGGIEAVTGAGIDWMQRLHRHGAGSIGETSTLAILIGARMLLVMKIASWRIMPA
jgi:Na+-transporting NADH:ubiquinone oxidoreductase subunit B